MKYFCGLQGWRLTFCPLGELVLENFAQPRPAQTTKHSRGQRLPVGGGRGGYNPKSNGDTSHRRPFRHRDPSLECCSRGLGGGEEGGVQEAEGRPGERVAVGPGTPPLPSSSLRRLDRVSLGGGGVTGGSRGRPRAAKAPSCWKREMPEKAVKPKYCAAHSSEITAVRRDRVAPARARIKRKTPPWEEKRGNTEIRG